MLLLFGIFSNPLKTLMGKIQTLNSLKVLSERNQVAFARPTELPLQSVLPDEHARPFHDVHHDSDRIKHGRARL